MSNPGRLERQAAEIIHQLWQLDQQTGNGLTPISVSRAPTPEEVATGYVLVDTRYE